MGMSRIFWDTNLFIYLLEGEEPHHGQAVGLRKAMLARGDQLVTSTLTLGEVLVKPAEMGDEQLYRRYEEMINSAALVGSFGQREARIYAKLRSDRSIKAPDAIQLSCAAAAGVDLFITNDARLQGKHVEGIQFIVPLDRVPL
jgi:predicted nucleic acid-binding protein